MAKADAREQAENLYVKQSKTCVAIAQELGVDPGTIYRWKAEAAKKGEMLDWDAQRRVYNLSPDELKAMYAESVKAWIIQIKADPNLLSDPKIADAISKHISVMQKLDTRGQYYSVALDLMKVINLYLCEHEPEIKEKLAQHWDNIIGALMKYSTEKRVF